MAHNIETMAYTNQVPWHGLGERVDNKIGIDAMMKAAKIDWGVERRPMFDGRGVEIPEFAALTRTSDDKVLDVVGSRYVPTQNREAFGFFKEFVEAGSATMETAGSLREGRYVWGLANLNRSFKLKGKDEVKGYLLAAVPHQQGKSNIFKLTTVRVVCNNTLTLALRDSGPEVRISHRSQLDEAAIERAKDMLGIAREQFDQFEDNAKKLKAKSMRREDTIQVLASVYQPDMPISDLISDFDEHANRVMKQLLDVNERAPGADPNTAWGVINAVTYYSDHVASRTPDKRLTNAWFGKTAKQKDKVLELLLAE